MIPELDVWISPKETAKLDCQYSWEVFALLCLTNRRIAEITGVQQGKISRKIVHARHILKDEGFQFSTEYITRGSASIVGVYHPTISIRDRIIKALINRAATGDREFAAVVKTRNTGISRRTKKYIILRDNCECVYCGSRGYLTMDHMIPLSLGGLDEESNIVACCLECNKIKNNRTVTEWFNSGLFDIWSATLSNRRRKHLLHFKMRYGL